MGRALRLATMGVPVGVPVGGGGGHLVYDADLALLPGEGFFQDAAMTTPAAVTDRVGAWADSGKSGNHHIQATADARPTLVADVANGLPGLQGDGLSRHLSGPAAISLNGDYSVFVLFNPSPAASGTLHGIRLTTSDFPLLLLYYFYDTELLRFNQRDNAGNEIKTPFWDVPCSNDSVHVVSVVRSGSTWSMRIDGNVEYTRTAAGVGATTSDVSRILATGRAVPSAFYDDSVLSVIEFSRALDNTDRQLVETYLLEAGGLPVPFDGWAGADWTLVVLPDTQYYSQKNPAIFDAQTAWIAANKTALNIQMVLHAGDIVETHDNIPVEQEWTDASEAMAVLEAADVPYLCSTGNHDFDDRGFTDDRNLTHFNSTFPQARFTWLNGGFFEESKSQNAYHLMTISGRDYLFLALELFPRDAVLAWADGLCTQYADRDVIIITHGYMYHDDTRIGPGDNYGKDEYIFTDVNDGEDMWTTLVSQHDNIVLVLSGHVLNDGAGQRTDFVNGKSCHQILANFQEGVAGVVDQDTQGGQLRIMTIKPSAGRIDIQTYSPWLDAYRTEAAHQFSLVYRSLE